jgi:nucleotide-binding universal stress UspA family protein
MFKHLLLPTDGSALSESAIFKGIEFAREIGAHVTGLHVSPRFHVLTYRTDMLEETRDAYQRDSQEHAARYLDFIARNAGEAGVACETVIEQGDHPYEAIIEVARRRGCDLIVMASHGRRGMAGLLMGSETQRVLTHAPVPVLIWR